MFSFFEAALPILKPLAFLLAAEWVFVRSIRRREGRIDLFEIGLFYSAVVCIYALFPAVEYILGGLEFSVLSDNRLYVANPSPNELAPIFWYYAIYLVCFLLGYGFSRGGKGRERYAIVKPHPKLLWMLIAAYASVSVFTIALNIVFRIPAAEGYIDPTLLYRNLPPVWQQLADHSVGLGLISELFLMSYLVISYQKYKKFIFAWLAIEIATITIVGLRSRTGLFTLLLSSVITYTLFVKPLKARTIGFFGVMALLLFVAMGMVRTVSGSSDASDIGLLASSNEFDGLFGNAYDLQQLKASKQTDQIVPWLYLADAANLLPDQLFPGKKLDPSNWYVRTFYPVYAENGGGFAFGAVGESIVGLGWIDVIWRGALIGWLFGSVRKYFITGEVTFWKYAFYLWMIIYSYQSFRVTTFVLLPRVVYLFALPALFLSVRRNLNGAAAERRVAV
jgi:hypothetical protein